VSAAPPPPDPGLCATCVHAALVRGARSAFWMCRLSASDPSFDRYPRLPILHCRGYQRGDGPLAAPQDIPRNPPP
jgi:hypothetical protein